MMPGQMSILTLFTFVLHHITFKVELNSNMLYKKGDQIYNGQLLLGQMSK